MARRDRETTYDLDGVSSGPGVRASPRLVLLLALVIILAALLIAWTIASSNGSPRSGPVSDPRPVATEPAELGSTPVTESPSISSSPLPSGSDAQDGVVAPDGSVTAATRFVAAWLERVPATRRAELEKASAPALAEQLMITAPENIPAVTPVGRPVLEEASGYSAQFVQTLSGGQQVRIFLVADPQSTYGWLATSVEKV